MYINYCHTKNIYFQAVLLIYDFQQIYQIGLFNMYVLQVKYWVTLNEPLMYTSGYETGDFLSPGINASGYGRYLSSRTSLLAHARAYHVYSEFRSLQKGT